MRRIFSKPSSRATRSRLDKITHAPWPHLIIYEKFWCVRCDGVPIKCCSGTFGGTDGPDRAGLGPAERGAGNTR